jgi:hypothetical protein
VAGLRERVGHGDTGGFRRRQQGHERHGFEWSPFHHLLDDGAVPVHAVVD